MSFLRVKINLRSAAIFTARFARFHVGGLGIALTIGTLIAAPPWIWHFSPEFQGVEMLKTNTEAHYLAQVQELYDGHYGLGNPYLAPDAKNEPYLFPPLGVNLTFGLGKLLGLSSVHAVMILRFFFTALLGLLVYFFVYALTGRRAPALIAAPFVILADSVLNPEVIVGVLRGNGLPLEPTFIDYGRPVTPQISSLFFFGYLIVFWQALTRDRLRARAWIWSAAAILGLSFYTYLFTWTFIYALNGCLLMLAALRKDREMMRRILVISLGAGLVGIPYLLHTWEITMHPWYAEVAPRFGFVKSAAPTVSRTVLGGLALFLLTRRLLATPVRRFFGAFFIAALLVTNEQVVTGRYVYNDHYHWYYNIPLTIIVLTVIGDAVMRRFVHQRVLRYATTALFLIAFFGYGLAIQVFSYRAALPAMRNEQRYAPLFAWLAAHAQKDATVFAPIPLADLIPALTPQNAYYTGSALYTLVPTERLLHGYLLYTFLSGISPQEIRGYLAQHRNDISGHAYGYTFYFQKNTCAECVPEAVLNDLAEKYLGLSNNTFLPELKKYPVNFLVWDVRQNPQWRADRLGLRELMRWGDVILYEI